MCTLISTCLYFPPPSSPHGNQQGEPPTTANQGNGGKNFYKLVLRSLQRFFTPSAHPSPSSMNASQEGGEGRGKKRAFRACLARKPELGENDNSSLASEVAVYDHTYTFWGWGEEWHFY